MSERPFNGDRAEKSSASDLRLRAIRGAITIDKDEAPRVLRATSELLLEVVKRNQLDPFQIVDAIFTVTPDIRSEFPARAARELGWHHIPCVCLMEMPVDGALPLCIRILVHAETSRATITIRHVYLGEARTLRPDLNYPD